MKWIITIPAILLFALAGCGKDRQPTNELILVDVTKNYPESVEAYGKGRLKGKLKEIAAKLDEESNPVIMLIKHKK